MKKSLLTILGVVSAVSLASFTANAQIAQDNADNAAYDDGWQVAPPDAVGDDGGFGYDAWVGLETTDFGRGFLTTERQVDGARSFALFAASVDSVPQGSAVARPLEMTLAVGNYTVLGRFDLNNEIDESGFNLKSTVDSTFTAGELLFFGMDPGSGNDSILVRGATNQTLLVSSDGEIRGDILQFSVDFDTTAGTFDLTVTNLSEASGPFLISGSLSATGSALQSLGFGNFNGAPDQNFIFDNPTIVPEPSTIALAMIGTIGLMAWRRRRS